MDFKSRGDRGAGNADIAGEGRGRCHPFEADTAQDAPHQPRDPIFADLLFEPRLHQPGQPCHLVSDAVMECEILQIACP